MKIGEDSKLIISKPNPLRRRNRRETANAQEPFQHVYCGGAICETDALGHPTPDNRSPLELVVDSSEGFIPLWGPDVTLRWRFNEMSMAVFRDPEAAKGYIRELLARGIILWEDASPVKFAEKHDAWDFEITMQPQANCSLAGCTLARAFFPDSGRHDIAIYPTLFDQPIEEQIETMAHELGHVFGLRHFFALVDETSWPAEIFGKHSKFSIMNYGKDSRMTENDRKDLKALYAAVWSGGLTKINGTQIKQFRPFSESRLPESSTQIAALQFG